jgi:hypothetical protein
VQFQLVGEKPYRQVPKNVMATVGGGNDELMWSGDSREGVAGLAIAVVNVGDAVALARTAVL